MLKQVDSILAIANTLVDLAILLAKDLNTAAPLPAPSFIIALWILYKETRQFVILAFLQSSPKLKAGTALHDKKYLKRF